MNLDKKAKKWLIISVLLLVLIALGEQGGVSEDKKQSTGEWGRVGFGTAAMILGAGLILAPGTMGASAVAAVIALVILGSGTIFSGIAGLLTPDTGIPGWAWIAGFGLLFFFIVKRKR